MCHFTSMLEWIHHFTNKHVAWTCGFDWTCPWVASWTKYMLTSKFSDRCLTAAVDAAGSECGAMNQDRCSLLWPCAVQCNAVDVPRSPHNAQPCKPRLGWSGRCWPPTLVSVTDSAVELHPATALGHQGPTQILGSSIFLANVFDLAGWSLQNLQSPSFSKQVYLSWRSHRKGLFSQTQFWSVMVILQKVRGHGFPANAFIFPGDPTEIVGSHFLSMLIPGKLGVMFYKWACFWLAVLLIVLG